MNMPAKRNTELAKLDDELVNTYLHRCPGLDAPALRDIFEAAEKQYMEGTSLDLIREDYPQVPIKVFRDVSKELGWDLQRNTEINSAATGAALSYLNFVNKNRSRVGQEYLDNFLPLLSDFGRCIQRCLVEERYMDVRRLTESAEHITKILSSAIAINGTLPPLSDTVKDQITAEGGKPVFSVNTTGPIIFSPPQAADPSLEAKIVEAMEAEDEDDG